MVVLTGKFDGRQVVLDGPVPSDIPPDTRVKVVFEEVEVENRTTPRVSALERLARMARPADLPPDYAEQHEHYVKGTPRK